MTTRTHGIRHVLVAAGRRIDAPDATAARFPQTMVPRVAVAIRHFFRVSHADMLVCSAACGADLLCLSAASDAGVPYIIVLPFERTSFRTRSVVDRPGDWGVLYDHLLRGAHDVVELKGAEPAGAPAHDSAYARANVEILNRAEAFAGADITAVIVWDGAPRNGSDLTAAFRNAATARAIPCVDIRTVP